MKVVMLSRAVAPYHGYGGMEKYIASLSRCLAEKGLEVEVITSVEKKGDDGHEAKHDGVEYTLLPPHIPNNWLWFWYRYHLFSRNAARYLRTIHFDILHSFGFPAFFYALNREKPLIVQPFGIESFKAPLVERMVNYAMWFPQSRYTMQKADAIAAEGEAQAAEIARIYGVSGERIFLLPDGVDLSRIKRHMGERKVKREDIGLTHDDFVLINVNRLEGNKGVNYLIDALSLIRQQLKNVKLIIIGTGSKESDLMEQVRDLKLHDIVLHFKNLDEDTLLNYCGLADLSVTPTLFEGLPLVILEAMACGLPVIATDVSENRQVVKNEVNGYLVPPADSQAIAQAVVKIYREERIEEMGRASAKIVEAYDWKIIARTAMEEYERLLATWESYR